jgi:hypothetical protein
LESALLWLVAVIAVLLMAAFALSFYRNGNHARTGPIIQVGLLLVLALAAGWTLDLLSRRDLAAERLALDARAFELATSTLVPGSALACLDVTAGLAMEEPCEKALFASPEATAAAVSYVAAQLALLGSARDHAERGGLGSETVFTSLRRAVEADSFGIVAHVLAMRDGCTSHHCAALALLHDSSRVNANLTQRPFEMHIKSRMATWPAAGNRTTATIDPAAGGSHAIPMTAGAKPANNLYFPSSTSIPPVHIMTAEPPAPRQSSPDTAGTTDPSASPRKPPSGAQARQPASPAR